MPASPSAAGQLHARPLSCRPQRSALPARPLDGTPPLGGAPLQRDCGGRRRRSRSAHRCQRCHGRSRARAPARQAPLGPQSPIPPLRRMTAQRCAPPLSHHPSPPPPCPRQLPGRSSPALPCPRIRRRPLSPPCCLPMPTAGRTDFRPPPQTHTHTQATLVEHTQPHTPPRP